MRRSIGKNVVMGANVIIQKNVTIGENCVFRNNIVIYEGTKIGKNCLIEDGAVLGKSPVSSAALHLPVRKKLPPLKISERTVIGTHTAIFRGTTIGSDCLIGDGVNIRERCKIGNSVLIGRGVTVNYHTTVGNNCQILDLTHLTGEMVIEEDVFISTHVVSSNDNFMGRNPKVHRRGPIIKKGALVGGGACLLPGVVVGQYSVIGAGAVVTKDIPDRKLALGVPAKVVSDTPKRFLPKDLR